jgi:hypothetical protein
MRSVTLPWSSYVTYSDTAKFMPCSAWMDASEVANARCVFEVIELFGLPSVQPAYQLTNVETTPEPPEPCGDAKTTDGVSFPTAFTAIDTTSAQLIRFGFLVKSTTDANTSSVRAGGRVEIKDT